MRIAIAYPPLKSEKGVALLTQNRQFQWFSRPTYIFPVVPATAATMLKKAGHEVLFLDGIASELSPEAFDAQLSEFRPDLVVLETKTPVVKRHWKWIEEHLPGGMDGTSGGPAPLPMDLVNFVYTHKTADLFVAAATMGGYAGGGDAASVEKLRTFALNLGLAFQYEDDLLDGDSPYSREKTEALVRETTAASIAALAGLPGDTSFLKALAEKLVGRSV